MERCGGVALHFGISMVPVASGQSAVEAFALMPAPLLTDLNSTAYAYSFGPYATATLTTHSGGTGVSENPYLYGGGLQDRATGHLKYGKLLC
jgi:hypothetical protein